jgi:hypothetical protein
MHGVNYARATNAAGGISGRHFRTGAVPAAMRSSVATKKHILGVKSGRANGRCFDEGNFVTHSGAQYFGYVRGFTVPRKIPKGRVLVHNHVIPVGFHKWLHNGASGFRAWTQKRDDSLVRCLCGWSDLPHYHFKGAFGRYWPRGPWWECERIKKRDRKAIKDGAMSWSGWTESAGTEKDVAIRP